MAKIIEPLRQEDKMLSYLYRLWHQWTDDPTNRITKSVAILFFHGLGDCVMFKGLLDFLRKEFYMLRIDILLQGGLGQLPIYPDGIELSDSSDEALQAMDYEYIFKIHFPVEVPGKTKSELCCELELGIEATTIFAPLPKCSSKFIGVHMFNTALPDVFNVSEDVAGHIWQEILDAGYIPIELAFKHVYHNPRNTQFPRFDRSVRDVTPTVYTLLGTLGACAGFIGVPSGPLHCAIAMKMDILYLQRKVTIDMFTHDAIESVDADNYTPGAVKTWCEHLPKFQIVSESLEHVDYNVKHPEELKKLLGTSSAVESLEKRTDEPVVFINGKPASSPWGVI